jgi:hypothetical protein
MRLANKNDTVIVNTGRNNGYGIPISVWVWDSDREHYVTADECTVCADSFRESVEMALIGAGFDYDWAASLCDDWGLEYPNDEDEGE